MVGESWAQPGVDVERTIRRRDVDPAQLRDAIEQGRSRRSELRDRSLRLGVRRVREGRDRRVLGRHRRTERVRCRRARRRRPPESSGTAPNQPPSGHPPVLGERGDHDRTPVVTPGALAARTGIRDPVVDLIADQPHPRTRAPRGELGEMVGREHGPRGVGRRRRDQAGQRPGRFQQLDRRLEPLFGATVQLDDLAAEGGRGCCGMRGSRAGSAPPGRPGRKRPGRPAGRRRRSRW